MVGAGVAGLTAARTLADRGAEVTVLEAGPGVGGRVQAVRLGDGAVDAGAAHVWTFYARTRSWLGRLGLEGDLRPVRAGGPSAGPALGDLGGILSCGWDVARWWRRLALAYPELAGPLDSESIADYAGRKLRADFVERMLRPNFEWNAFCGLDEMSRVLLLQSGRLFLGARPRLLSGGLGRLPAALAAGLELLQGPEGEVVDLVGSGRGVTVRRRQGRDLGFDGAVVATLPAQAVRILPWLADADRVVLSSVRHSTLARAWWDLPLREGDPEWLLRQRLGSPRLVLAGRSGKWLRVTVAAYGDGAGAIGDGPAALERLRALAVELWPELARREPVAQAQVSWERAVTIFAPGHFQGLARLGPAPLRGRVALAGDYLVSPTLEGAVISGERAAERILSLPILSPVRSESA